jgi:hypothetical protein
MKTIKLAVLALFLSLVTVVQAQVNINDLVRSVGQAPEDAASMVEQAVRSSPEQVHQIIDALLANYPELAEEIVLGAIAGLPAVRNDVVYAIVQRAILSRPNLAPEIALGARRATVGMDAVINRASVDTLKLISTDPNRVGVAPGQRRASAIPGVFVDGSVLSPAAPIARAN